MFVAREINSIPSNLYPVPFDVWERKGTKIPMVKDNVTAHYACVIFYECGYMCTKHPNEQMPLSLCTVSLLGAFWDFQK